MRMMRMRMRITFVLTFIVCYRFHTFCVCCIVIVKAHARVLYSQAPGGSTFGADPEGGPSNGNREQVRLTAFAQFAWVHRQHEAVTARHALRCLIHANLVALVRMDRAHARGTPAK